MKVWDEPQGTAIQVETPDGRDILINTHRLYQQGCDEAEWNNFSVPYNYGGLQIEACPLKNSVEGQSVMLLKLGQVRVVVCGAFGKNITGEGVSQLAFWESVADADILVASHTGKDAQVNAEFIKWVNPGLTILSGVSEANAGAVGEYEKWSRGWRVFNIDAIRDEYRKCLTTSRDGVITIEFGESMLNPHGILAVCTHV